MTYSTLNPAFKQSGEAWWNEWKEYYLSLQVPFKTIDASTLEALNPLDYELKHAAIRSIDTQPKECLSIGDINLDEVNRVVYLRSQTDSIALYKRVEILPAKEARKLLGWDEGSEHPIKDRRTVHISKEYPYVLRSLACQIRKGVSPKSLCYGYLSHREAHEWFSKGGPTTLIQETNEGETVYKIDKEDIYNYLINDPEVQGPIRSITVARWLNRIKENGLWGKLTKRQRTQRGTIRYIEILDEIEDGCLPNGVSTGIDRAFEIAFERIDEDNSLDHRTICKDPFTRKSNYISVMDTPSKLYYEGKSLNHCVNAYRQNVESGECLILSINTPRGRSTVELDPETHAIKQHKGVENKSPPEKHVQLLDLFLRHQVKRGHSHEH